MNYSLFKMRKNVSMYTRMKAKHFKLILKGWKILEEKNRYAK